MPLTPGNSRAVVSRNIAEMVHAGYPQRQAVAASLSNARRHRRDMGGMIPRFDDGGQIGGLLPSAQNANPIAQGQWQRYESLPTEKLQELAVRLQGTPQAQLVQKALQQKQLMPQQGLGTAAPTPQPPAMAGGGPLGVSPSMASPWWERSEASGARGFLSGSTSGRADTIKTTAPGGAYVLPADVISGLGDGNSLAGARIMDSVIKSGPWGTPLPRGSRGSGPPHVRAPAPYVEPRAKGGGVHEAIPVMLSHGEMVVKPEDVVRIGGGNLKHGHEVLDAFVLEARRRNIEKLKKLPKPAK